MAQCSPQDLNEHYKVTQGIMQVSKYTMNKTLVDDLQDKICCQRRLLTMVGRKPVPSSG